MEIFNFMAGNMKLKGLIEKLKKQSVLQSGLIEDALWAAPREFFVPEYLRERAYEDEALPIGRGQTISQPYTVAFMLELLQSCPGQTIFDVGYGSGWQSALLAHIVGERGRVYAFEAVPELCEFGSDNLRKFSLLDARVIKICCSATNLKPNVDCQADRIISAASVEKVPLAWRKQLKTSGIMVYPAGQSIWREKKIAPGRFAKEEFPGFVFVPYI